MVPKEVRKGLNSLIMLVAWEVGNIVILVCLRMLGLAFRRFLGLSVLKEIFGAVLEQRSSRSSWPGRRHWALCPFVVCGAFVLVP